MKILTIKRQTKNKKFYSKKMGMINVPVTYIRKYLLGFRLKTIHQYRETYYGEVKNCEDCNIYA